jgi:HSP20 family protein
MAEKTATPVKAETTAPAKAETTPVQRYDPFGIFDEMERFWRAGWPFGGRPFWPAMTSAAEWTPRLDAYEKDGHIVMKVEVPGIKREDLNVTLEGTDLVVRGEAHRDEEVKEKDYYRMERHFGGFYRRFPLPFEAKTDQIHATYTDGVLEIEVPRPPETKPEAKTIKVA